MSSSRLAHDLVREDSTILQLVAQLREPTIRRQVLARRRFLDFLTYMHPEYTVSWHHELLANTLERWADPDSGLDRLMVFCPPQHGKSEQVSRNLPPFILGKIPTSRVILGSYAAELAEGMSRDVQRNIESAQFAELFPSVTLPSRSSRAGFTRTDQLFDVLRDGQPTQGFRCAGILGGVTGMPATHLIVDDPVKNQQEADSKLYRDRVFEEYTASFKTRLRGRGKILICMTRWHEDDLAGRLLQQAKDNPKADQWEVLSLPAIAGDGVPLYQTPGDSRREGEPLWPDRFPVDVLQAIKAGQQEEGAMAPRKWYALYQCTPHPKGGKQFIEEYFARRFALANAHTIRFETVIAVCDANFKSREYAAGEVSYNIIQVWGRFDGRYFLLDHWRSNQGYTVLKRAIRETFAQWGRRLQRFWIEDKASGSAAFDDLHKEFPKLEPLPASNDSKASRACVSEDLHAAGKVLYPDPPAPWFDNYVAEHTGFPHAKHNDEVDTAAYALIQLSSGASRSPGWWW